MCDIRVVALSELVHQTAGGEVPGGHITDENPCLHVILCGGLVAVGGLKSKFFKGRRFRLPVPGQREEVSGIPVPS